MSQLLIPFLSVGLAELGDKTMLAVILLACQTKRHIPLFIGIVLGFAVVDGAAIILGSAAPHLMPVSYLRIFSGLIFILFGVLALRNQKDEEDEKAAMKSSPFVSGFMFIFSAEWGDKTQIAAGLLATKFPPWSVFIGAVGALALLSFVAIYAGKLLSEKINPKALKKAAGFLFIVLGIALLLFG